jgi:hypothetical protein
VAAELPDVLADMIARLAVAEGHATVQRACCCRRGPRVD